jgi:hypothetical protein
MAKKKAAPKYVVCIRNDGYAASLEARKIYRVVADDVAARRGFVRIIDESGEDYLFPANRFVAIEVPQKARAAFADVA